MEKAVSFNSIVGVDGNLVLELEPGQKLIVEHRGNGLVQMSTRPIGDNEDISPRTDAFSSAANIGDVMEDGSIYAGISPTNNKPFFTIAREHLAYLSKNAMLKYIGNGEFHSHKDWQLASLAETQHLYQNRTKGQLTSLFGHQRRYYRVMGADGEFACMDIYNKRRSIGGKLYFFPIRYNR